MGDNGRVFALDLLPMGRSIAQFMQGDFHDEEFVQRFEALLEGRTVDFVMSDIAPIYRGFRRAIRPGRSTCRTGAGFCQSASGARRALSGEGLPRAGL